MPFGAGEPSRAMKRPRTLGWWPDASKRGDFFNSLLSSGLDDPCRGHGTSQATQEKALKRIFALWRVVAGQDLRLLWFAIRHEERPVWLLPALAVLGLFAVEPLNFAVPVLGAVDELVFVPLILHGIVKMLPAQVLEGFGRGYTGRMRRRT
jgi:uncharacterized membrane protein YkvA (DUF1232 family)